MSRMSINIVVTPMKPEQHYGTDSAAPRECFRYCLITADIDCGVSEHPQQRMEELGYVITRAEPVPIADCWIFEVEKDDSIVPPPYLTKLDENFFDIKGGD